MVKIIGIDLAGLEKNDTGFCVLEAKSASVRLMKSNLEIVLAVEKENQAGKVDLLCIDGPTTLPVQNTRRCDDQLSDLGVLPPLIGGMRYLTMRASKLRTSLEEKGYKVIEVSNNATARVLGYWDPEPVRRQKSLLQLGITGDIERRMFSKDEVDSVTTALAGLLFLEGKADEVGDNEGLIVVPQPV